MRRAIQQGDKAELKSMFEKLASKENWDMQKKLLVHQLAKIVCAQDFINKDLVNPGEAADLLFQYMTNDELEQISNDSKF